MTMTQAISVDPAVSLARQAVCRFAAVSLLDPNGGAWQGLRAVRDSQIISNAAAVIRELPTAHTEGLGVGERPLEDLDPHQLLERLP